MSPDRQLLLLLIIFALFLLHQESRFTDGIRQDVMTERDMAWALPTTIYSSSTKKSTTSSITSLASSINSSSRGMAACLMVRDDNALLYEWLAHHYVVLPLRHVLVASDMNATQDPGLILERWKKVGLKYQLWTAPDFVHRFGPIPVGLEDQNHHYLHRQRAFFTACAEYMLRQNETWVAFVDTDEYIVLNKIHNDDDRPFLEEDMELNSSRYQRFRHRHAISDAQTVSEALELAETHATPLDDCLVMPRLLISALENVTCPELPRIPEMDLKHVSTFRFVQTAQKNAFYPSKWGKVMVRINQLDSQKLHSVKPKSSHRPFVECPKPLRAWEEALVTVLHYLGDWERYSARNDSRRSRRAFEDRAYFSHGTTCNLRTGDWLPRLIQEMGIHKTKYLLGMTDSVELH